MRWKIIVGLLIVFLLVGGVYYMNEMRITGKAVIDDRYSYTKAICEKFNGINRCVDMLIECENGEVKSLKPLTEVVEVETNRISNNSSLC
jgi:hypothetical protein